MSQDCTSGGGGGGEVAVGRGEVTLGRGKNWLFSGWMHLNMLNAQIFDAIVFSVETVLKFDPQISFVF